MIRVLVWNEFQHEKSSEKVAAIYPNGIHNAIADFLRCDDFRWRPQRWTMRTAELLRSAWTIRTF